MKEFCGFDEALLYAGSFDGGSVCQPLQGAAKYNIHYKDGEYKSIVTTFQPHIYACESVYDTGTLTNPLK